ncbi:hypothetical protein [uncultured Arthrobacter sp.]
MSILVRTLDWAFLTTLCEHVGMIRAYYDRRREELKTAAMS